MASFTFSKTGLFRHTYRLCDTPEDTYRALEKASPRREIEVIVQAMSSLKSSRSING
jgi:hypothetical protein